MGFRLAVLTLGTSAVALLTTSGTAVARGPATTSTAKQKTLSDAALREAGCSQTRALCIMLCVALCIIHSEPKDHCVRIIHCRAPLLIPAHESFGPLAKARCSGKHWGIPKMYENAHIWEFNHLPRPLPFLRPPEPSLFFEMMSSSDISSLLPIFDQSLL